jgi:hypothetical protein
MLWFSKSKKGLSYKEFEDIQREILQNFPVAKVEKKGDDIIIIKPKFPVKILEDTYKALLEEMDEESYFSSIILSVQNPMSDYAEDLIRRIRKHLREKFPKIEWEEITIKWDKDYSDKQTLYRLDGDQVLK